MPSLAVPPIAIRRVLDTRDLKVVYQPLVDLKTKKIFAYEALVRSMSSDFDSPMSLFAAAVQHQCTGELGRIIREMARRRVPVASALSQHPSGRVERQVRRPARRSIFKHTEDVYLEITEGAPLALPSLPEHPARRCVGAVCISSSTISARATRT